MNKFFLFISSFDSLYSLISLAPFPELLQSLLISPLINHCPSPTCSPFSDASTRTQTKYTSDQHDITSPRLPDNIKPFL
ncbi:unnamed protein product [Tilletia controversa]|nr:unnamed protein product [Tilletia controversa]